MEKGVYTDITILDFSKAFDTVPLKKLLHKLKSYGLEASYITGFHLFCVKNS